MSLILPQRGRLSTAGLAVPASFVGSVPATATSGFPASIDISSLPILSGDLGIFISGSDDGDSGGWFPTGYTVIVAEGVSGGGGNDDLKAFAKIMDGTETSIVVTQGPILIRSAFLFCLFRGFEMPLPANGDVTTARSEEAGIPDPPSITTSGEQWVFTCCGQDDDALELNAPTDYTLVDSVEIAGGFAVAAAYREDPAALEDPGIFDTLGSDPWAAATIRLTPAS